MTKQHKLFIVNFKNYTEVSGCNSLKLAQAAEYVANRSKIKIAVAPPAGSLANIVNTVSIPVFAQHLDHSELGSTTGFMVPEIAKSYGASGSLINHSEHRLPVQTIKHLVERLRNLKMVSVVCTRTPAEVRKMAEFAPDYIAIEPPELIGSGIAVSKAKPSVITRSIDAVNDVNPNVSVICGAGIVSAEDVSAAIRLGSRGILVASGIVKAKNWKVKIKELADAMKM
ncbi:MAG: triose-phosphate isomerase [Nitrososphaerales archaeon]